ncbi:kinesin, putative [Plasmodium berghei]|uniref:Kinesin, putative n=2 Tax=Plasmodium berghei TaxID=5821 RepID=A0A509AVN2_PLABA|nr:kinesin, putative [Plasmodium berghei ANKA]CXJ28262.1 kinesin, putative [Plasmodium berghei]SCM27043.1 kinesin, putative [Plasmodium berghei]SCN28769.1 kinesin, putative [Plasmodium berghei]SCO63045.1 kinesin, putative [Plasmodium berghei]SCO64516.1 kinesin, putative [Plasmodium berghei]|eukprot:XP_034424415.1 kinesin, putative [Plasmodium berghei ANKA]
MVNKTQKGDEGCDGGSKQTDLNKETIGEKIKGENAKLYEWYISKNIEEKKKNNIDIKKNIEKYFEDAELTGNVEEYINVICRIKNMINNDDKIKNENNINDENIDIIKKVANTKLVIDTYQMGTKSGVNFEYTYDRVYDINNNNNMIFNDYIINNIKNIFQGINCSILAYGQTNSGKTHTMLGKLEYLHNLFKLYADDKNNDVIKNTNFKDDKDNNIHKIKISYNELTNCIVNEQEDIGLILHCINYIFMYIDYHEKKKKMINELKTDESLSNKHNRKEFIVTLSIIEIYNEVIYDLISGEKNLSVNMIDPNKNEFVIKNLKEVEIENVINALQYLEEGVKNRKIAFTHMNKASSRSHLIFIIKINRYIYETNSIRCGKLCLVDLAGSERLKQTKATGSIQIETTMINKSLSVLSKVINALAVMQIKEKIDKNNKEKIRENNEISEQKEPNEIEDLDAKKEDNNKEAHLPKRISNTTKKVKCDGTSNNMYIPYRDSKLTRVLSDSLGNNCKSILICTISSQLKYLNETASTIKFAQRAKMVKAKPVIREEKLEIKSEPGKLDNNKENKNDDNKGEDKNFDIFVNFNKKHITKDILFFSYSLCIFSYICGFKSTGKVKYLDFFIESYKNKINIIKEQLNKNTSNNEINECILKTFDDLKLLTEEEKKKFTNFIPNKIDTNKIEEKIHNSEKEKNNEEGTEKLTHQNLNKINCNTNLSKLIKNDENHEEDDDPLIGDILVKMKNDICNIIKFNLKILKDVMKPDEMTLDEMIDIVNTMKDNNNIFLLNELNQIDEKNNPEKDEKSDHEIHGLTNCHSNNNNPGEIVKNKNIQKYSKEINIKGDKKRSDMKKKKNKISEIEEINQDNKICLQNANGDKNILSVALNGQKWKNLNGYCDKNMKHLYFARNILSIKNIQNIFNYINNNYTKFINDFTTDKSTVFTNFDLKENLDRQVIEKNNTIYNFIHSATMFQNSGTLKNLNSNYIINKMQTEFFNNNCNHQNIKCVKNMNENYYQSKDFEGIQEYPNNNNTEKILINSQTYKSKFHLSVTDLQHLDPSKSVDASKIETEKNVKFSTIENASNISITNEIDKQKNIEQNGNELNRNYKSESLLTLFSSEKKNSVHFEPPKTYPKIDSKKGPTKQSIHVSKNEEYFVEFEKLLENDDFKKLYEYIIDRDNKSDENNIATNLKVPDELLDDDVLKQLESKINDEIQKINNNINVDICSKKKGIDKINRHKQKNVNESSSIFCNRKSNIISSESSNDASSYNNNRSNNNVRYRKKKIKKNILNKNNNVLGNPYISNTDISYLETKRNANVFFKNLFNMIKNFFNLGNDQFSTNEPIEINIPEIINNELLYNKKFLEKNLESYNIRNFQINNKKMYLLNESEYAHLKELINYKNKMLYFLNLEYKKYKLSA